MQTTEEGNNKSSQGTNAADRVARDNVKFFFENAKLNIFEITRTI